MPCPRLPPRVLNFARRYAPISIRLVQQAVSGQWLGLDDALRMLPGPLFEVKQAASAQPAAPTLGAEQGASEEEKPITLVVFVGGCTCAEVAALRWLSRRPGVSQRFVILTTHMCTGSSLIGGLIDRVENNLAFGPEGLETPGSRR